MCKLIVAAGFLSLLLSLASCTGHNNEDEDVYIQTVAEAFNRYNNGDKAGAMHLVDSTYATASVITPYAAYKRYFFKKWFYYYEHDYVMNSLYTDSMLYVLEKHKLTDKYPEAYALALNAKADHYYTNNDLQNAFEYYYRSRIASEISKDTCAMGNQTYHLGMVAYRRKNYNESIQYFKQAYLENMYCGGDSISFYRAQELLSNVALSFTNMGHYDSALMYYNKTLQYIERESVKYGSTVKKFTLEAKAVVYGNLAKIYIAKSKYGAAEQLLLRSVAINEQPGYDNGDALFSRITLAELYHKLNRANDVAQVANDIRTALDTIPNLKIELRLERLLYQHLTKQNREQEGWAHLERYVQLRDSFDYIQSITLATDQNQLFKMKDIQHKYVLLHKNHQLNQLYLVIAVSISALTLIIILLILFNFRKTRKNINILKALNRRISDQKEQLKETTEALIEANASKDKILNIVAHDLRGPVGGIGALADNMLPDETDKGKIECLQLIKNTSEDSLVLINDLLEYNQKQQPEKRTDIDIISLAREVANVLTGRAQRKQQTIQIDLPEQPYLVRANKNKIWRVFNNLITNAIKFSHAGEAIRISASVKDRDIIISIADQGIGIPAHEQVALFQAFSDIRRLGTDGESSHGMGLYICKQIIENSGGKIWFESTEGTGSTFYIEMPLVRK